MTRKKILVTGGCGFIGSNMTNLLLQLGYEVIVIDDFSNSFRPLFSYQNLTIIESNISNSDLLTKIFQENNIYAVFYFSASIESKISMEKPEFYFRNNVINTLNFLEILLKFSSQTYFVFSSTASVYESSNNLIDEDNPKKPENVYGKTKLFIENVLQDYGKIHGLKYAILRYFNACGADMDYNLGENRKFETHLIPLLMRAMVRGDIDFYIYGNDYNTKDGTCIRDFVHVKDIALAHLAMLNYLQNNPASHYYFNIGTQSGFSVQEIVNKAIEITKIKFDIKYKPRRIGDPDSLVASNQKIKTQLNWQPKFSSIENIIETAWQFEKFLAKK